MNADRGQELVAVLKTQGRTVFRVQQINMRELLMQWLHDELISARAVVVLWTGSSVPSRWEERGGGLAPAR